MKTLSGILTTTICVLIIGVLCPLTVYRTITLNRQHAECYASLVIGQEILVVSGSVARRAIVLAKEPRLLIVRYSNGDYGLTPIGNVVTCPEDSECKTGVVKECVA